MSDRDATLAIREAGIDIAVDLKGYTENARWGILAHRPAPIQVNYLGYPGTMGTDFIDYILVDRFIAPPIFDIWMRLLEKIPESVLWLLKGNDWSEANLRKEGAARDIDPERIVFAPHRPLPDHLARYRLADLFLDTLPYNPHTTASDALWVGLPVLTCLGKCFAARVAGSLLEAVGLAVLITTDLASYETHALKLAHEPQLLAGYAKRLAENRISYSLFDCERFTRNMEAAYMSMWRRWQDGKPPEAFSVAEEFG